MRVDLPATGTPPETPQGLTGTVYPDAVLLTWDDPNDDSITGYRILRRNWATSGDNEFDVHVDDTGKASAYYYDDQNVTPETAYVYRIQARNEHGLSDRSRWFNANTPAEPTPTPTPDPTPKTEPVPDPTPESGETTRSTHNTGDWAARKQKAFDECIKLSRDGAVAHCNSGYKHLTIVQNSGSYEIDWSWWDDELTASTKGAPEGYSIILERYTFRLDPEDSPDYRGRFDKAIVYETDSCEFGGNPGVWMCNRASTNTVPRDRNGRPTPERTYYEISPRDITTWSGSLTQRGTWVADMRVARIPDDHLDNSNYVRCNQILYDVKMFEMHLYGTTARYNDPAMNESAHVLVHGGNGFGPQSEPGPKSKSEPTPDDFPNNTGTGGRVVVNESAIGFIGRLGLDRDAFKVDLEAGGRYRIEVREAEVIDGFTDGTLFDPGVVLRDTDFTLFTAANGNPDPRYMDDDSGVGLNARLDNIRPSADGTYFITVENTGVQNDGSGVAADEDSYRLYVTRTN